MGACVSTRSSAQLLALDELRSEDLRHSLPTTVQPKTHEHSREVVNDDAPMPLLLMPTVKKRFPWLLGLMLVQSISGVIVDHFSALVEKHVVIASFLTMLVGGGGNSSGQTIVETVRLLTKGSDGGQQLRPKQVLRIMAREIGVGAILALLLGVCAYPRVRLLSAHANHIDALTIAFAYFFIVVMANAVGVVVAVVLHTCDMAAVGAPPVVQVTVDVLGVLITMCIAQAILGEELEERELREARWESVPEQVIRATPIS